MISSATNKAKKTDNDFRHLECIWKLQEVIEKVNIIGKDVFCLTETKKKGHGIAMLGQFMLAWSGVEKSEIAGVAILIRKNLRKNLRTFRTYSMSMKGVWD